MGAGPSVGHPPSNLVAGKSHRVGGLVHGPRQIGHWRTSGEGPASPVDEFGPSAVVKKMKIYNNKKNRTNNAPSLQKKIRP